MIEEATEAGLVEVAVDVVVAGVVDAGVVLAGGVVVDVVDEEEEVVGSWMLVRLVSG
jgi:ligand-binding sensor protein